MVFSIGSLTGSVDLRGEFESDSDVALFEFIVDGTATFSALTTSYLTTGFDSMLGLFDASTLLNVTYLDPANENQPTAARGADISADNYDDQLGPFVLGAGTYFLALLNNNSSANGFSFDQVANLDSLENGFGCDDPTLCLGAAAAGGFSLTLAAVPDVDPPQPVPEPGTFALLGTGALAALARRRRSRKRV
jgi:hypothetical protein